MSGFVALAAMWIAAFITESRVHKLELESEDDKLDAVMELN